MQQVDVDQVNGDEGDAAFILQLRPDVPPGADLEALTRQIDQFVSLYLNASAHCPGRYAPLSALTWAVSAGREDASAVEALRDDLADTLFGRADSDHVRLVRQNKAEHASEADSRAPGEPQSKPGTGEDDEESHSGWEPAHSSAATRAAMDDASNVLDLDAPMLDIVDDDVFKVDAWTIGDSLSDSGGEDDAGGDAEGELEPDPETQPEWQSVFDADDALDADADDAGPGDGPQAGSEADFDDLTESPERKAAPDIASELAAFRTEMREIAAGIPGANGSEALDEFRSELDSITGALGQRVDGAAQRIESAADRVAASVGSLPDAERMAGAVERAEASAAMMESSVRDAVDALTAALKAMNGAAGQPGGHAETGA